jgi:hypothetical protein
VELSDVRDVCPATPDHLWEWVYAFTGISIAREKVCRLHSPPFAWFASQFFDRPSLLLILGARGSGKSFLEAILTHLESRFHPGMGTRILGGSLAQSHQIYQGLDQAIVHGTGDWGSDGDSIAKLLTDKAIYRNGSNVSILAASRTSVRGPHVPSLRLDEVDEIDPEIRESAIPMAMSRGGMSASVSLTSTWHRVGGPMGELLERAEHGEFPSYTTCVFDVLERCPEGRSGPYVGGVDAFERCPACPIRVWCHSERDRNGGHCLAKLSDGHYAIDTLILQAKGLSERAFEADMLCKGPRADGAWFTTFSDANIDDCAEYDPRLPVHLSVDSGVHCGAVAFQVRHDGNRHVVTCFHDRFAEGVGAEGNALAILDDLGNRRGTRFRVSTDNSGGARNPVGPTVLSEFERSGLRGDRGLECWPTGSVADSLATVEALICAADGTRNLLIHPRCKPLIAALKAYRRAKRNNQWQDYPEDPQHPHEDMVDALRGGLRIEFPQGFRPQPQLYQRSAASMMY